MHSKIIATKLTATLAAGLLFIGCMSSTSPKEEEDALKEEPAAEEDGTITSEVVLGKVGVLSKSSAINLRMVYFTLVSSAADTVKDSAAATGSEQVAISKTWTLKPLRQWTIHAKSVDTRDSVIHQGSSSTFNVLPASVASVNFTMTSRFTMYVAKFQSLPDSISSTASGTGKDKVNLNRVTLKVDGTTRADSLKGVTTYFAGGQEVVLYYDYIQNGSRTVILEASGKLNGFEGVLYRGTTTVNVGAGVDTTTNVTLNWVGPTTGSGTLTVTLGRVGKVLVNGTLPGAVIP